MKYRLKWHSHGIIHWSCKSWGFGGRWLSRMLSSGMWRGVALVRTDVSEERIAPIIRAKRMSELRTLAVNSNCQSLLTLFEARYVPPKRRFLQEKRGVTSQKTTFLYTLIICNTTRGTTKCYILNDRLPYIRFKSEDATQGSPGKLLHCD
jgi:hypothetical protein